MIEAGWDATYGRDLADDLLVRRKTWRWFLVRLVGLLDRDTPTATILSTSDTAPIPPPGWSPEAVGDELDRWAQSAKRP